MLTAKPSQGAPNWISLATPDIPAATEFYGRLFDWRYEPGGAENDEYGCFRLDGRAVAGVSPLPTGGRGEWVVNLQVKDPAATAAVAMAAGGVVRPAVPPTGHAVPAGWGATLTDPTGARFRLRETKRLGWEVAGEPGAPVWVELYSTDAPAAADFYRAVFGWVEWAATGGAADSQRLLVAPAGAPEVAHGGITQLPARSRTASTSSHWHPYVAVIDCDAVLNSAVTQGATVLVPPTELPSWGRLAMFADPAGAVCGVLAGAC